MPGNNFWTKVFLKYFVLFVCVWILLALYPNPGRLVTGLKRIFSPHTDPTAVTALSQTMPSDPALIEKEVDKLITYSYDWQTYDMPWYTPSVREVLQKGKGDCKAQALVLASILQEKGIPYHIQWSLQHVWVDYPGKVNTGLEKNGLYQKNPQTGKGSWQLPTTPPEGILNELWMDFVRTMPDVRKIIVFGGLAILVGVRVTKTRKGEISPKSRLTTTLLSLFLGVFGAHRFYTGRTKSAIVMLCLSAVAAAGAWFVIGIPFIMAVGVWALFDAIFATAGAAKDSEGRVIKNW